AACVLERPVVVRPGHADRPEGSERLVQSRPGGPAVGRQRHGGQGVQALPEAQPGLVDRGADQAADQAALACAGEALQAQELALSRRSRVWLDSPATSSWGKA